MRLDYWCLDSENSVIFSNSASPLPGIPQLKKGEGRGVVDIDTKRYRYARTHNQGGFMVALSPEEDPIEIFNEKVDVLKDFLSNIQSLKNQILDDTLHNLTAIHGHNVQEIHNIIPEDFMYRDFSVQIADVKHEILNNADELARALIQIIRNNKILRAEFDNIRLLHTKKLNPTVRREEISQVVQGVLYLYYPDFGEKRIKFFNSRADQRVNMDYSLFVGALIPIFENLLKYVEEESSIHVGYFREGTHFVVRFEMRSLAFAEDEQERLFDKGYSGSLAKSLKKDGTGLGLYQAKRLLALNRADVCLYSSPKALRASTYRENVLDIIFRNP